MADSTAISQLAHLSGFTEAVPDAIPIPMFLVDRDMRVYILNACARERLDLLKSYTYRRRGGHVLGCLHSVASPGGCGTSSHCRHCAIRSAVNRTFSGQRVWRENTIMQQSIDGNVRDVHLLITTAPVRHDGTEMALLMIEDISELMTLASLVPMCASCKKVRPDEHSWQPIEDYFKEHLDLDFSHGICPDCARRLYGQYEGDRDRPSPIPNRQSEIGS